MNGMWFRLQQINLRKIVILKRKDPILLMFLSVITGKFVVNVSMFV